MVRLCFVRDFGAAVCDKGGEAGKALKPYDLCYAVSEPSLPRHANNVVAVHVFFSLSIFSMSMTTSRTS
jgi:hypothetical protein